MKNKRDTTSIVNPINVNIPSIPLYVSINIVVADMVKKTSEIHFNKLTTFIENGLILIWLKIIKVRIKAIRLATKKIKYVTLNGRSFSTLVGFKSDFKSSTKNKTQAIIKNNSIIWI